MIVHVTITVGPGETVPRRSPMRLATEVMQALDLDPDQDQVHVIISATGQIGSIPGTTPPPQPTIEPLDE